MAGIEMALIFVLGICIGYFVKGFFVGGPIGSLTINKSNPEKPFFEVRFTEDIDKFEQQKQVLFDLNMR